MKTWTHPRHSRTAPVRGAVVAGGPLRGAERFHGVHPVPGRSGARGQTTPTAGARRLPWWSSARAQPRYAATWSCSIPP